MLSNSTSVPRAASHKVPPVVSAALDSISSLPDASGVPLSSWGLLRRDVILVTGFADRDLHGYLGRLVCAARGQLMCVLADTVNKAICGPATDPK